MYAALLVAAALGQVWIDEEPKPQKPMFLVEETVDLISIAHIKEGGDIAFFWSEVQGEWACLDYRWMPFSECVISLEGDEWTVFWRDDGDSCWRKIRSKHWIETWEDESPLAVQHNRPWFARLLAPGLKQPPAAK